MDKNKLKELIAKYIEEKGDDRLRKMDKVRDITKRYVKDILLKNDLKDETDKTKLTKFIQDFEGLLGVWSKTDMGNRDENLKRLKINSDELVKIWDTVGVIHDTPIYTQELEDWQKIKELLEKISKGFDTAKNAISDFKQPPKGFSGTATLSPIFYSFYPTEFIAINHPVDRAMHSFNEPIKQNLKDYLSNVEKIKKFIQGLGLSDDLGDFDRFCMWYEESILNNNGNKIIEYLKNLLTFRKQIKQVILKGPPGTGKTYIAKKFAKHFTENKDNVKLIQFHPSYSYEDFIESIRPKLHNNENVVYELTNGIFKEFCNTAKENPNQKYVLIIDEINRGNLSKIFGELIYALEYRNEELILPYSQETFSIPDNVYIIGTMNTADRSIALMDIALRRRFMFMELMPDAKVLENCLEGNGLKDTVLELFNKLNDAIKKEVGLGKDFQIGHSHFMVEDMDEQKLKTVWKYSIMPLLEEYFFNDLDRIDKLLEDPVFDIVKET